MESLRNAATAAASYVGLGGTPEENRGKQLEGSWKQASKDLHQGSRCLSQLGQPLRAVRTNLVRGFNRELCLTLCFSKATYISSKLTLSRTCHADLCYLEGEASHIAGGEAPQNVATGTSQSGIEPVSGKLGRGEAGEPYDAGNLDGMLCQAAQRLTHANVNNRCCWTWR